MRRVTKAMAYRAMKWFWARQAVASPLENRDGIPMSCVSQWKRLYRHYPEGVPLSPDQIAALMAIDKDAVEDGITLFFGQSGDRECDRLCAELYDPPGFFNAPADRTWPEAFGEAALAFLSAHDWKLPED